MADLVYNALVRISPTKPGTYIVSPDFSRLVQLNLAGMVPQWMKAHPQADLSDIQIPRCFEDVSYGNDIMPSFHFGAICVWVDYRDPEMSEMGDRARLGRFACSLVRWMPDSQYEYSHFWHKILRRAAIRNKALFREMRESGRDVADLGRALRGVMDEGHCSDLAGCPGRLYVVNGATRWIEWCGEGQWQVTVSNESWKGPNLKAAEWRLFCWCQYL